MKKKFEKEINIIEKYFRHLISQDPVLREIKSFKVIHGGGFRYENKEKELHSPLREISTDIVYKYDEIRNFELELFCNKLYDMVNDRIGKLQRLMYEEIKGATELTGNIVDARGSKFNPEILLQMLEKVEIRFDDNGEPILPQLHVAPETFNQIKNLEYTQEYEKKRQEIIEQKRRLWYAKKRYRKLSFID